MTEPSAREAVEMLCMFASQHGCAAAGERSEDLIARLEAAEQGKRNAEAWVISLAYDHSMGRRTMCRACMSHSTGRVEHKPGCYVASLEVARANRG